MALHRKRGPASSSTGAAGPWCIPAGCTSRYPTLCAFLTQEQWEDGTTRTPGGLSLFFDGGRLKAVVNDKDASLVGFLTLDSLSGLLDTLEAALASDALDWRPARAAPGRPKTR